MNFAMAD